MTTPRRPAAKRARTARETPPWQPLLAFLALLAVADGGRLKLERLTLAEGSRGALVNRGLHNASAFSAHITQWWTQWPDANIAIRTGVASNLVVIDLDDRPDDGREGMAPVWCFHLVVPERVPVARVGVQLALGGGEVGQQRLGHHSRVQRLQRIGLTLADVGATSATAVTLAANISLAGAAGSGGLSLGSMTGATALPTGALSWAGAANQNLSLVGSGTGTVAINNASTMSIGTSGTTTLTLGRSGQSTVLAGNVSFSAATRAAAAAFTLADPGNAGAIPVTTDGVCALTSAGAETRTLAIPTFMGQRLSIVCDTYVGNIVVTSSQALNQAGNTIMTFGAVRDYIALEAITVGGALRWQVLGVDGVALS